MYKAAIFDLDQTLIDSSIAESFRKQRNWQKVYSLIPQFKVYNGIQDVIDILVVNNIKIAIVTTSPGTYAKKVLQYFNIPYDILVDYFSTSRKKPDPEPMLKAIELLCASNNDVISFGDRVIDIISANSANIRSCACLWGSSEKDNIINASPTFIANSPIDLIKYFN